MTIEFTQLPSPPAGERGLYCPEPGCEWGTIDTIDVTVTQEGSIICQKCGVPNHESTWNRRIIPGAIITITK